jgi:NDP-sugar pyrophosphorylase family protein
VKAFVLAGGFGTRLLPAFSDGPKALAPVGGRPFLERLLEILRAEEIADVVLCTGHRAAEIEAQVGDGAAYGLHVVHSVEPGPLGTGGALAHARAHVAGPSLVLNGDTLVRGFRAPLELAHRRLGACATVALALGGAAAASGNVDLDACGRVIRFAEKPPEGFTGGLLNAGVYLLEPEVFHAIPAGRAVSLEREVLPRLLAEGRTVAGALLKDGFVDLGTPEGLARAEAAVAAAAPR